MNRASLEHTPDALTILALFWTLPQEETWADLSSSETAHELAESLERGWDITLDAAAFTASVPSFEDAKAEYIAHIAMGRGVQCAPPLESLYKPWTEDPTCQLPHAREKGFVMGDPAYHIINLLNRFEIQIPDEIHDMPDHLSIILNLAAVIAESGNTTAFQTFVMDHLDWLDEYRTKLANVSPTSFYLTLVDLLSSISCAERTLAPASADRA